MRFFLIAYAAIGDNNFPQTGNIYFSSNKFPSNSAVKDDIIMMGAPIQRSSIVVTNVFEFKNEEDFNDFKGL